MILFNKQYDGGNLYDAGKDISEAFYDEYAAHLVDVPKDRYHRPKGTFTVTIEWKNDN